MAEELDLSRYERTKKIMTKNKPAPQTVAKPGLTSNKLKPCLTGAARRQPASSQRAVTCTKSVAGAGGRVFVARAATGGWPKRFFMSPAAALMCTGAALGAAYFASFAEK
ncbi:hypothetical protein EVAR_35934_1 [Eumeta japonica]|uniref:Uncharacterized protein n=1 Tax=Eumeta variegata TaxID=151549 RepID=A0A4C1W6F5_EUMVA|nr:hypothetical protein EVAR_35934_1 [Eumeta japonica]